MMSVLIICVIASILCERRMANLEGMHKKYFYINFETFEGREIHTKRFSTANRMTKEKK